MNKDSKIYVVGHLGLVGSALFNNLKNKGYTNLIGRSIDELDLMDAVAVKDFFDKENPEYVILAAAHVGGIMANSVYRADFIYKNLQIQQNVIVECYKHNVKKLLFLGSTCIYPKDAPQPMGEDALLTGELEYTNEPYAIAKIAGLKMCESFNLQYGTNFIAVMPTNLYGPNDNFHLENSHVMPAMIRKIFLSNCLLNGDWSLVKRDLDKRPIEGIKGGNSQEEIENKLGKYGIFGDRVELWGTGAPLREFLWSEEMADACIHIMERVDFSDIIGNEIYSKAQLEHGSNSDMTDSRSGKGGAIPNLGEIRNCHINIGTGKEVTIKELAYLIKDSVGYKGDIIFDSTKPDGTMRKLTNPAKLHSLGWHHKVEINEGVCKLYNWYLNSISN